jgi:glycerol-3-phosphate acyltransferase PlsY
MAVGELFELIAIVGLGFILGSIPTAVVIARLYGGMDIRQHGSGNPGATNAIRQLGWAPGLLVLAIDVAKGALAVLLVTEASLDPFGLGDESARCIAGTAAVAGHIWSLFARLRGGKGVATAFGALLAIQPIAASVCALLFATVVSLTRIVSLASMIAIGSLPVILLLLSRFAERSLSPTMLLFAILLTALVVFAHRTNIAKLVAGTEPRFRSPPLRRR